MDIVVPVRETPNVPKNGENAALRVKEIYYFDDGDGGWPASIVVVRP